MPHAKRLPGYPLRELRVKQGSNIIRMFYFAKEQMTYVVASGYVKKTDKTSRTEIDKAMRLRAVVLEGEYEDN
jgi:phage-related protein